MKIFAQTFVALIVKENCYRHVYASFSRGVKLNNNKHIAGHLELV